MVPKFSFHTELDQDLGPFHLPEHGQALDRHLSHVLRYRIVDRMTRQGSPGGGGRLLWPSGQGSRGRRGCE